MRAISAADAISPAIQRTKEFLFKPFRWGTYLKLGTGRNHHRRRRKQFPLSSHGGGHPSGNGPMVYSPFHIHPEWIAVIVAAVLVAIVVCIVVFYLVTRLRFAFFHCLIHNIKEIRPGWYIYRDQAMRFFWINLVVGLCFLLVVAVVALPFVAGFWRLFHEIPPGGHPDFAVLLALVLPLIPIILLLVVAGILADVILRDWMLPHYALENATALAKHGAVSGPASRQKSGSFLFMRCCA